MADAPDLYVPNTWPPRYARPAFKGSKAEARTERETKKASVKSSEDRNKTAVRQDDEYRCRFPRCSCHARRLAPEVAHVEHKKSGGDPLKQRSKVGNLICLCRSRHQESRVSLHAKTIRPEPLTAAGTRGPVRWWVDATAVTKSRAERRSGDEKWVVVAVESRKGVLEPLNKKQAALLEAIAELGA